MKMPQFISIILGIILVMFLNTCGQMTSNDEGMGSKSIEEASGITPIDTTSPVIAEVTVVTTPTTDSTPNYTFSSTEAGSITYGGSCSSGTTSATSGNNTIFLVSLSIGTYSDCTTTVTDAAGNVSSSLTLTSFTVAEAEQMGGSFQGGELSLSTVVTTLAGTGSSGSANVMLK